MSGSRLIALLAVVTAMVFVAPIAASAATTYEASPTGSGSCAVGSPCSLATAVSLTTMPGDDIRLVAAPDESFAVSSAIFVPTGVTVHGAPGARPLLMLSGNGGVFATNADSLLRDVAIESTASATLGALEISAGGTAERVSVEAIDQHPCLLFAGGTIRDSICWYDGIGFKDALHTERNVDSGSNDPVTLRNVTAVASFLGSGIGANITSTTAGLVVNATNVIASGAGGDVVATRSGGNATLQVNLQNSNYDSASAEPMGPVAVTPAGPPTNQTTPPVFINADPPAGDFHQGPTSVGTIDLGTAAGIAIGELDLDGAPRTQGAAPDIGAYEATPPIVVSPTPQPTPVTPVPRKKCKKGKKLKRGKCVKRKRKRKKKRAKR